jgi:hypothetical protein
MLRGHERQEATHVSRLAVGEDPGGDGRMGGTEHGGRAPIIAGLDEPPRLGEGSSGKIAPEIRGTNPLYGAPQLDAPCESRVDRAEIRRGKSAANRLFRVEASAHYRLSREMQTPLDGSRPAANGAHRNIAWPSSPRVPL